uniref:Uncharacterized protein n=1 Tax=Scleropages formosus TaxID=113540 RepID=A0A8C9V0L8_SCLFO
FIFKFLLNKEQGLLTCFILLQTRTVQSTTERTNGFILPRLALLLGMMRIGMSSYSTHQLMLHHKSSSRMGNKEPVSSRVHDITTLLVLTFDLHLNDQCTDIQDRITMSMSRGI